MLLLSLWRGRRRISKDEWWLKLRPLLRILAKHESIYEIQAHLEEDASAVDAGDKFTS